MDEVMHRIPAMEKAEIRQLINGPESFTPDLHTIMGEAPEVMNEPINSAHMSGTYPSYRAREAFASELFDQSILNSPCPHPLK